MTGQGERFIQQIEAAADDPSIPTRELRALLRRAALKLRNAEGLGLDADVGEKFTQVAALTGTDRRELATRIIRRWLTAGGYLP